VVRAEFVETTLANGIPLVSAQTSNVPIATITVVFPGGDATDPADKAGLAQMAAGVADKGTGRRSATEIARSLESLGASLSISSSEDGTFISLTAPSVNLAEAGEVLVDVIRNASYPAEELERERKRTLDGLEATYKDPGALANLVASRVFYGDAPYGQVSSPASIPQITREDLIAHRETYWHPGSAKLVISGGIAAQEAADLANDLLGDWTSDLAPPAAIDRPAGSEPPTRTVVIDMPDAGQAAVIAGFRTLERKDPDFYNLWLANTVLGSGSNGWLFEEVRTKRALSYGAYSALGTRADTATLTANAQTKNESADEVAAVFLEQFERLAATTLDEDTLNKRRLFLGGALARNLETSSGFNGQVASLMLRGIEPAEAFAIAERLAKVTPVEAQRVSEKFLNPEHASLVIVGDAQYFLEDLERLRDGIEVIPFDDLDLSRVALRKETAADLAAE